jgi:hypothetical protein
MPVQTRFARMRATSATAWVVGLLVGRLVSAQATEGSGAGAEPEAMAPPPFTAEELRMAITVGESWRYRVETSMTWPTEQLTTVIAASSDSVRFRRESWDASGAPMGDPSESDATWAELVTHALYPARSTTIEEVSIEVAAGTYAGWRYTVTGPGGSEVVAEFARELPGPPVRYASSDRDLEPSSSITVRLELLEHVDGAPPRDP